MVIQTGINIKGYELRERIGAGGFGAVYRAYQTTVGREVAIKIILPGLANQPDFIRRFETEAQLVARLEHPHITPLYDYWRDPDGAYLVMRWLRGGSLREALVNGAYDVRSAALLLDQLCGALALAHRNQVIHRDVKPGNILLDEDGNAYLADFGIAKDAATYNTSSTSPDAIVGSLDYLSPEQARSEAVTPRTDIYSLGVVLYELLTGEHPFTGFSSVERLYKHINDPLPEIRLADDIITEAINRVIQQATAKNPDHRYPDALALAADFREAAGLNRTATTGSIEEGLTQREHDILALLVEGLSNKEIAARLTFTHGTVKWYVNQIYTKLRVRSRVQAIIRARELNLIGTGAIALPNGEMPVTSNLPEPENPYKGLRAFQTADAGDFFGREELVKKLLSRLEAHDGSTSRDADAARFLAVVGPSGSGKSSLVRAGLIPALLRGDLPGSERWFVVEMLPGTHPLDKLEVGLMRVATNQAGSLNEQLRRDKRGLLRVADLILPADGSELVIVIDQFEEVFALVEDEASRVHFLDLLCAAVKDPRSRIRIVVTLRADFYDRPLHYPEFGELLRNHMETILPLGARGLERAIQEPARRVGVTFEDGLVATIVGDVNYQAGALPLLQYALTELFEQRQARQLTHEAYRAIGGAAGALAKRAEALYQELSDEAKIVARQMFLRLVTPGEGTEDTRRRATRAELASLGANPDALDEVIDTFTEYRLLSLDHDPETRSPTVEVAHEAMLREWERLRGWVNESRSDILFQRQLAYAVSEWHKGGQDDSYLLTGARLVQAEERSQSMTLTLTPGEQTYLHASLKRRDHEASTETERQAREQSLEYRSRNFLRGLVATFLLAALLAGGLAIFALNRESQAQVALSNEELARHDAEASAAYAGSIALAAAASSAQLQKNPDQAIALAVAANSISASPPAYAQSILYDLAFKPATRSLFDQSVWNIGLTPDGTRLIVRQPETTDLTVIDINSQSTLVQWAIPLEVTEDMCLPDVSLDGERLHLLIWDEAFKSSQISEFELMTGREIRRYAQPSEGELIDCGVIFSPDGQHLIATTSRFQDDRRVFEAVIVWDTVTGEIIQHFQPDTTDFDHLTVRGYSLSLDGQKLLLAYDNGQVVLWDINTRQRIGVYGAVRSLTDLIAVVPAYTSAGIVLIVSDQGEAYSTTVIMWDEISGELLHELTLEGPTSGSRLSPDGLLLQVGLWSYQNVLLDLATWQTVELYGNQGNAASGYFLPHRQFLSVSAQDGVLRLWNLDNGAEVQRFTGMTGFLTGLDLSPDGRTLAAQQYLEGEEAPLVLWDVATGKMLRTLTNNEASARNVVFSPDGRFIVSASNHQIYDDAPCNEASAELRLIDTATGEVVWEAHKTGGTFFPAITFSQDGSRILTGDWGCDRQITVWDAATGEIIEKWGGHQAYVWAVSASPDGRWIASADDEGMVLLRDSQTGKVLRTFSHPATVATVLFSPDNRLLLTADLNSVIHLWDIDSGTELRQFAGHNGFILFVEFSPDGRYFVSSGGGDSNIFVWDVASGEIIRRISQPVISPVGSVVAFSHDGQSIFYQDETNVIHQVNLMLEEGALLEWVRHNRYLRDLTCGERQLYRVEPLCPPAS